MHASPAFWEAGLHWAGTVLAPQMRLFLAMELANM